MSSSVQSSHYLVASVALIVNAPAAVTFYTSETAWAVAVNATWGGAGTMPVRDQTMRNGDPFVYYLDRIMQFSHNDESATGITVADSATQTIEIGTEGLNGFVMFPFNGGTMVQHRYSWRALGMWIDTNSPDWVVSGPGVGQTALSTGFFGWLFDETEHTAGLFSIRNSSPTPTTDSLTVTRIDFNAGFVPEPGSAVLAGIGASVLLRRRRK